MNVLGSVFLGDAQRHRVLSSPTTPPMSPNATGKFKEPTPVPIDPRLSLELRIRWLEVLLLGVKHDALAGKGKNKEKAEVKNDGDTLVFRAEEIQKRLDNIVEGNDGLQKFVDRCTHLYLRYLVLLPEQSITVDQHSQILTPAFALSGSAMPPSYSHMSSEELDALLAEMEPEIRSADRDLREIDVLDKRGILGAGKLAGSFLTFRYFFDFNMTFRNFFRL